MGFVTIGDNPECAHQYIITKEGRTCMLCAEQDISFFHTWPPPGENHAYGETYKRIFYFHEKMSQYNGTEPQVPPKLLELLTMSADYHMANGEWVKGEKIDYQTVRQICKFVSVDCPNPVIRRKFNNRRGRFRSQKFKRNQVTDLLKFAEKWISLNWIWSGVRPRGFTSTEVNYLHSRYLAFDREFDSVRHNTNCPRKPHSKCHKSHKCRYAMISVNLLVKLFFKEMVGLGLCTRERYEEVVGWWPQLAKRKTRELKDRYYKPIYDKLAHISKLQSENNEILPTPF